MASNLPTIETLNRLLSYDPETGVLTWKRRGPKDCPRDGGKRFNARYAGKEAFRIAATGYRQGMVHRKMLRAHRIAWAIAHGEWPAGDIDHINGVRSDNRLENLRVVSRKANSRNQRIRSNSRSGVLGVAPFKNRWRAYINIDGRPQHLGIFERKEDAIAARRAAETLNGYHPNHGVRWTDEARHAA